MFAINVNCIGDLIWCSFLQISTHTLTTANVNETSFGLLVSYIHDSFTQIKLINTIIWRKNVSYFFDTDYLHKNAPGNNQRYASHMSQNRNMNRM